MTTSVLNRSNRHSQWVTIKYLLYTWLSASDYMLHGSISPIPITICRYDHNVRWCGDHWLGIEVISGGFFIVFFCFCGGEGVRANDGKYHSCGRRPRDWTYCSPLPECSVPIKFSRPVLITIVNLYLSITMFMAWMLGFVMFLKANLVL